MKKLGTSAGMAVVAAGLLTITACASQPTGGEPASSPATGQDSASAAASEPATSAPPRRPREW